MAEKITFYYDEEADMLEVSFQPPQETIADECERDIFVHYSTETETVVKFYKAFYKNYKGCQN